MKVVVKKSDLTLQNNRKTKIFIFFLVLTSIIWLLIELSKTYTSSVIFKIEYKNLSSDKLVQVKPISKVEVAIKDTGFSLLKRKIKPQKITFNLNNLLNKGSKYFILPNMQLSNLNAQLTGESEIMQVLKDTIFIEIGKNSTKKVPVIPKTAIQFKLGYNFIEKLQVNPDSITISGPKKYIDSIKEIKTTGLELEDVYESIETELDLIIPKNTKNVVLSSNKIKLTGAVDKFTEGSFKTPVVIINQPESVNINPFPKQIEVVFQAGLSNFTKINENSFLIVFDYKQYENDTTTQFLTPIIKQKSEYISSLKINPPHIEFLLQK
ncbi:YbbR-like domain-containing protein [Lutibacter sp. A80]|uniref:CdaR family protein n=1 Tax=Lutibacter sp. A80 TaxID=2918453 RepID=UPI001F05C36C|nr:YbbR-like domain-containing protein [Lutibacter sp. A80]UMB61557.1 YbbR-like domain-containing protein [Lutibacter sp. A80]